MSGQDILTVEKDRPIILIVEDNKVVRAVLKFWMNRLMGNTHDVICSVSVKTALVRIRRSLTGRKISFIVLDWHFRGKETGRDLIVYCEAYGREIPIVVLTGDRTVNTEASQYDNVKGFFIKPLTKNKWKLISRLVLKYVPVSVSSA